MIQLGRDICSNFAKASQKEWLVTNGIGGYAAGTISGQLTRRYHGLLIATLAPPLDQTLLLSKIEEEVNYKGKKLALYTNHWSGEQVGEPHGYLQLEHFKLEGTIPVWRYAIADAWLEKRVWMQRGTNTTYIYYTLRRSNRPLMLKGKMLVNYRNHHRNTHTSDWQMALEPQENGLKITAFDEATPFYLFCSDTKLEPNHTWYRNFYLSQEAFRGLDSMEDHLFAAEFEVMLEPGNSVTFVATTEVDASLEGASAYKARQDYEKSLINKSPLHTEPIWIRQLVLAADQFIVKRNLKNQDREQDGVTIIAGYPWFGDWGRDTMISLPDLTMSTGRPDDAKMILRTFANFVDQGMVPNRFPDNNEVPEYNTADATLWYIEATRAYFSVTDDKELLKDIFPIFQEIIEWHLRGTRYNIKLDARDTLLYAGEEGTQLTWMDAKIGDWVVTPRIGKPVEINALWYNVLCCMKDFADALGLDTSLYTQLSECTKANFQRFWFEEGTYLYDVLDGTDGTDTSLRPNQFLAVSLPHSPLTSKQQKAIVDICAKDLLSSYALRSLSPDDPAYQGQYQGNQTKRDAAYHQGTVWAWLIGPFVSAHYRVYKNATVARSFLLPFVDHLQQHALGSISEIFDAKAPFTPRGTFAQAWSVAEVLRVWQETDA